MYDKHPCQRSTCASCGSIHCSYCMHLLHPALLSNPNPAPQRGEVVLFFNASAVLHVKLPDACLTCHMLHCRAPWWKGCCWWAILRWTKQRGMTQMPSLRATRFPALGVWTWGLCQLSRPGDAKCLKHRLSTPSCKSRDFEVLREAVAVVSKLGRSCTGRKQPWFQGDCSSHSSVEILYGVE